MSLVNKLLSASGGVTDKLYVDDVFSAYTYVGNGSSQTINNGIDLAGKGGLVWMKGRSGASDNILQSNLSQYLSSNTTAAASDPSGVYVTAFNNNGFSLGFGDAVNKATSPGPYVSWTFRKAPKFFDVVTWTGNNLDNRAISHSLGVEPGMVIIKCTSGSFPWVTYHRSLGTTGLLLLNTSGAVPSGYESYLTTSPNSTNFFINWSMGYAVNDSGRTYVAYLFAHDTTADGIVQCGSYTGNGAAGNAIALGYEPQFLLVKQTSGGGGSWVLIDSSRGFLTDGASQWLYANLTNTESTVTALGVTATGFVSKGATLNNSGETYIYIAIRRSNKPPTVGTEVYHAIARTGTGAAATVTGVGFAPDLLISSDRNSSYSSSLVDRLRGSIKVLRANVTNAESSSSTSVTSFDMNGVSLGDDSSNGAFNATNVPYINHFFRRAVGVFDEVCYTGTGSAITVQHGLGVVPELIIIKIRNSSSYNWAVYHSGLGATKRISFNTTDAAATTSVYWNNTNPTNSVFNVGTDAGVNGAASTIVAYLFASKAGISKVFSYTGNGTSQTIDCGFTTGARFCMIKRTDSTGDWYVWDSVRGIVASNDPHLSLNTTSAEVTGDDSIDPASVGFIVNQVAATNINVSGGQYIGLSFA
jgi:hypothetical protein